MTDDTLLSGLNEKQVEAVTTTEGPVLVIAGAGSGKTRVLTHRVAYLIREKKAEPEQILTVTFTNKAANEIKERIGSLLGNTQNNGTGNNSLKNTNRAYRLPWSGTFHSICAKILRIDGENIGLNRSFTIYDPDDQMKLVREAMKELNIGTKNSSPRSILSIISSAKNELMEPQEFAGQARGYLYETAASVYPLYQKKLDANQALDFDDLIFKTIKLLQTNSQIRDKYQNLFKYVLVDEYQDTNFAQYTLIKILSGKYKNIFVVGDDAQSIYRWRGADIRNILDFENDFEGAKIIKLEQNYRSTKVILSATNAIIRNNSCQKPKNLWTNNSDGELIKVYQAFDERDEAMTIAEKLLDMKDHLDNIAVVYRTNAQSRVIEEVLLNYNIPYRLVGAVRFYDRKEVKDILAYLRLLVNPSDNVSLERIINTPKRGIGKDSIEKLKTFSMQNDIKISPSAAMSGSLLHSLQVLKEMKPNEQTFFNDGTLNKLLKFSDLISKLSNDLPKYKLLDFIKHLIEETSLTDEYKDPLDENISRLENIEEFINIAGRYDESYADESLSQFLEDISLLEEQSKESEKSTEAKATLMTIHSAKGLEFDHVFVTGLEENLFPHSRSYLDPEEMQEERRLAYVAFTRAKANLFLSYAMKRTVFGSSQETIPSRFIAEIPKEYIEFEGQSSLGENDYNGNYSNYKTPNSGKNYAAGGGTGKTKQSEASNKNQSSNLQADIGDRVRSEFFGDGTILAIDEDVVKISFDRKGVKELATEYAKLVKI